MATKLTFEIASVNDPKHPAPNNWFIFCSDGTVYGPGSNSQMNQELGCLEMYEEAKRIRLWRKDSRRIPNRYSAVFKETFGFNLPSESFEPN